MKCLILFSGTKSLETSLEKKGYECRGLDNDNHFTHYYKEDILKWEYKEELLKWTPQYIHASPICKEFTMIKNNPKFKRDMSLGISLIEKSFEIINYVLHINPKLKWTMENPVGLMRKLDIMKPYKRITTSYCKYGFGYRKNTDFWTNFDLKLKQQCNKKEYCDNRIDNYHKVEIAYKPRHEKSITDTMELLSLKEKGEYKNYTGQYFRYRIPELLCDDIVSQLEEEKPN